MYVRHSTLGRVEATGHRVSTAIERKGVGGDDSSVKLNLTDPCRTVPQLRDARRAGSPIAVKLRKGKEWTEKSRVERGE